jgi:hypothetical protein
MISFADLAKDFLEPITFTYKDVPKKILLLKAVTYEELCDHLCSSFEISQVRNVLRGDGVEIHIANLFANDKLNGELLQAWGPWTLQDVQVQERATGEFKEEIKVRRDEKEDEDDDDEKPEKTTPLKSQPVVPQIKQKLNVRMKDNDKAKSKPVVPKIKPEIKVPTKDKAKEQKSKDEQKTGSLGPARPKMTPWMLCRAVDQILRALPVYKKLDLSDGSTRSRQALEACDPEIMAIIAMVTGMTWDRVWNMYRVWRRDPDWITEFEEENHHRNGMMTDCPKEAIKHWKANLKQDYVKSRLAARLKNKEKYYESGDGDNCNSEDNDDEIIASASMTASEFVQDGGLARLIDKVVKKTEENLNC